MTLTEMKYIVAVATERHFGRAAARCFVSQPSLSASVKKLEEELGVQLFERGKSEVLVTKIGERVIAQVQRALTEAEQVKVVAQQGKNPLQGALRLGVIQTIAPYLLPKLVEELRKTAPSMPLDIEENLTANLDQMLKAGQIDAAIVSLPYEATGTEVTPLYDEAFRVIVPAKHAWARRKRIDADELHSENLLLLSIGHCFRDQVLDACHEFARAPAPGRQGNSLETIRNMVASGLGISVLPASALTQKFSNPLVKAIDFVPPVPSRRAVIVYRQGFPRRAVIDVIARATRKIGFDTRSVKT